MYFEKRERDLAGDAIAVTSTDLAASTRGGLRDCRWTVFSL